MGMFRKKPVVIEAHQWFKNGDHPEDDCVMIGEGQEAFLSEGKIVRRFRRPDVAGYKVCQHCAKTMHEHGWIDTFEGGHVVCPGDWVIKRVKGEFYNCKPDIFEQTYDPVPA